MRRAAISLHLAAALVSAGTTAAILAALVAAGVFSAGHKPEPKSLTLVSLARHGGEASEAETRPAEPQPRPAAKPVETIPRASPLPTPMQHAVLPAPPIPSATPAAIAAPPSSTSTSAASAPGSALAAAAPATAAPPGIRDGLNANGPVGTSRAYAARVRSWLLSHKIYPKYARMRRIEGVVHVRFVLDRAGQLVEGALAHSSGETLLDAEGEAMLRRASPYPPAPADIAGDRIAFTAAIAFELAD